LDGGSGRKKNRSEGNPADPHYGRDIVNEKQALPTVMKGRVKGSQSWKGGREASQIAAWIWSPSKLRTPSQEES
jgi:hypothetical protein